MKTIGIIGYGNVGETLSKYIQSNSKEKEKEKEIELLWICSKHFNDINIYPNTKLFTSISEIESLPDTIFITSNDREINNIATMFSDTFSDKLASKIVIHTSGALGREVLIACEQHNAITIAAHPFQTFYSKDISCLKNIFWGIEINDTKYSADITKLIRYFGGHPFFLSAEMANNKALYHTIAVSISNYVAGAIKLGTLIAEEIKLPQKDFFIPIINQTIDNCFNSIIANDGKFPLTGPIIRNDTEVINAHIKALDTLPNLQQSYIDFANALKNVL